MFLSRIKLGQAYLVAKRNQNQRKIMSRNFDFNNKPMYCKRDVLLAFEVKNSTELFVSNWRTLPSAGVTVLLPIFQQLIYFCTPDIGLSCQN